MQRNCSGSKNTMSDEESFIVLGSTPTPSMEQYLSDGGSELLKNKIMNNSTAQTISNNFSIIQDESLNSTKSTGAKSLKTEQDKSAPVSFSNTDNALAASVIMGDTKSSLFQAFPSLMQSSMPINEVQMLQHLMNEHGQMKDSLQKANVAMRKNFTNIQKWQDEVKLKYTDQVRKIDEQCAVIEKLEVENEKLKQALTLAEARSREQEKRACEQRLALEKELQDAHKQIQAERTSAVAEIEELKKVTSEKQSILQNMAKEIERLELEKQEFVVVKPNKPDTSDGGVSFINKEEHDRQIKVLQREMSVHVAKNLEFEDMQKIYIDELNCMKVNLTAAENVHSNQRLQMERMTKDIETKDVSLAENIRELKSLAEQVDVLTAQLDIYKVDFEAERSARAELASEKDHILSDLKLLQKRNQQLIDEIQNRRVAEDKATDAANESMNKRESPEASTSVEGGSTSSEEQTYARLVLRCPLCNGVYKDISTLQNHVEDCVGSE